MLTGYRIELWNGMLKFKRNSNAVNHIYIFQSPLFMYAVTPSVCKQNDRPLPCLKHPYLGLALL